MLDLSVVVPVRNTEQWVDACLASIVREQPREIFVVDGESTDRTCEIAGRYPVTILSDHGKGLPTARRIGAEAASSRLVALIDCDVVLHEGALASLMDEYTRGGYIALQAGLHSVSGPGYWGQALARHHRTGRSKQWFGVVASTNASPPARTSTCAGGSRRPGPRWAYPARPSSSTASKIRSSSRSVSGSLTERDWAG